MRFYQSASARTLIAPPNTPSAPSATQQRQLNNFPHPPLKISQI